MRLTSRTRISAVLLAAGLFASACGGAGRGGSGGGSDESAPGITDDKIELGSSLALSGPLSVYGDFGKAMNAYFQYINETEGGVDGRKIEITVLDDGFDPARTLENVRRLNEQDKVFAIVGIVGTQPNLGVLDYTNEKEIPTLFLGAGTAALGNDPEAHPWTVPYLPPYPDEAKIVATHVISENPDATVAILARDDDGGTDFIDGFEEGIKGSNVKIVKKEFAAVDAPTVDSQMVNLANTDADVFLNVNNPKQASQAITFVGESNWKPTQYVASYSSSIEGTLKPAGIQYAKDIMSTQYLKDPADPQFADDPKVKQYLDIVDKYGEGINAMDVNTVVSGVVTGQMMVEALKLMEDPTREGLMDAVESMDAVEIDMLVPGVTVTVSDDDHNALQCMQVQRFDGKAWELIGEVICGDE